MISVAPPEALSGHVIVCGLHSVGLRVIEQLHAAISRARQNGRLEHPLRREAVFEGGDQAYLIGPYEELLGVLRRDQHA